MIRRSALFVRLVLTGGAVLAGALPLRAADLFYLELLRDGAHAYDRGEFAAAARALRLACFGLLDEPKPLGACLARLALAQDKAADVEGFRETFTRLVEVEERFQGYSQADLPPEVRTALEQRLAARIPAPTLESSPQAFRALAKKPAGQTAAPAPKGAPAAAAPAQLQPRDSRQAAAPPPAPSGSTQPAPIAARPPGPRPLSDEEKGKLESVRKALGETGKGKELRQVFQTAREVADAHPESVEAQRLAGEAAYRLSRWSDAVAYLQRGGGLPDSEPELLFYLAVSLFESGDRAAAAAALRRSLPNLQRTPYIDAYARKILGS
jgi:tetratricopeptide (TPR) repeat protein